MSIFACRATFEMAVQPSIHVPRAVLPCASIVQNRSSGKHCLIKFARPLRWFGSTLLTFGTEGIEAARSTRMTERALWTTHDMASEESASNAARAHVSSK